MGPPQSNAQSQLPSIAQTPANNPVPPMPSAATSMMPSIAQTPAHGVMAPAQTMQSQFAGDPAGTQINSGSGPGNVTATSQNEMMRQQMMMQMLQAGSRGGLDPAAMMQQMMAAGALDTSQSGMNLESTRNNINGEFQAPPGMMPPPEFMQLLMGGGPPEVSDTSSNQPMGSSSGSLPNGAPPG